MGKKDGLAVTTEADIAKLVIDYFDGGEIYQEVVGHGGIADIVWVCGQIIWVIEVKKKKFGAKFGSGFFEDEKLILLKPGEFMNRSGGPVATAFVFFKLDYYISSDPT